MQLHEKYISRSSTFGAKATKGRTIRKVMGGGGGGGVGQNQKKIYSQKKIRKKNLPRHSAKKIFLAWNISI